MTRPEIYTRPNKPLVIPVRKRGEPAPLDEIKAPEIVAVDRATEMPRNARRCSAAHGRISRAAGRFSDA